jgi:hypothetical protein
MSRVHLHLVVVKLLHAAVVLSRVDAHKALHAERILHHLIQRAILLTHINRRLEERQIRLVLHIGKTK